MTVYFHTVLVSFCLGLGSVFLAMLVVKAILVICFLCVGFLFNWLNADRSQNCEKIDRSIHSIFRLPILVSKYCFIGDTKQVSHN